MSEKKVLSLGQCGPDHAAISAFLRASFGADVTGAHTFEDALAKLRKDEYALVLVNRVLDFDGGSGLEFIEQLKGDPRLSAVPVMLVSNFEDAQEEAVARGALPGFGKSALRRPETQARLRAVLAPPEGG